MAVIVNGEIFRYGANLANYMWYWPNGECGPEECVVDYRMTEDGEFVGIWDEDGKWLEGEQYVTQGQRGERERLLEEKRKRRADEIAEQENQQRLADEATQRWEKIEPIQSWLEQWGGSTDPTTVSDPRRDDLLSIRWHSNQIHLHLSRLGLADKRGEVLSNLHRLVGFPDYNPHFDDAAYLDV